VSNSNNAQDQGRPGKRQKMIRDEPAWGCSEVSQEKKSKCIIWIWCCHLSSLHFYVTTSWLSIPSNDAPPWCSFICTVLRVNGCIPFCLQLGCVLQKKESIMSS
jgi:hypothetical protein